MAVALAVAEMMLVSLSAGAQDNGLPPETLAQSVPIFAFQSQGNRPALVFTRSGNAQEQDPRVFVSARDGVWRLIQLPDELHNTVWIWVGRAISRDEVWGVTLGGTGVLQFVSSGNGGRSWKLRGSLQKVSKAAVLDSFSMNDEGHGSLILRLDEDSSPNAPRLGYYLYITKNGGKTWSDAMYSQGKPTPPPALLAPPDRTFDNQQPFETASWQRLLTDLQPVG
ncbi:MAG: hypothetical protein DMF53_18665 [Acidobacteria bacterium]|nr:MAG: hypothetical protein DMF53_18665 [Acidobacteriota bacterium]